MLLIELNEYNPALLRRLASRLKLEGLKEVFSWRPTRMRTADEYDSGFLEPWVQWVSVHTGTSSAAHQIKNLGDVPSLAAEQVWERWSRAGRRSVIWGVMNGGRRDAKNCEVFIPDPWTFSEPAYPAEYEDLIKLPRYLATNYAEISKSKVLKDAWSLFAAIFAHADLRDLRDSFGFLIEGFRRFGMAHVAFIVFFEHVSAMAFLRALKMREPDDAIIFINSLAHVQHHYWRDPDGEKCPQIEFAAKAVNDIVEKILKRTSPSLRDKIFVTNALSQKCTHDEPAWILHRPKNPKKFVRHMGLSPTAVEPLMTHDAHLTFATPEEAQHACEYLRAARIGGERLFHAEPNRTDPRMIFYRLDFFGSVDDATTFIHGNTESRFRDHFVSIVKRTGKHIQDGEVMANWPGIPDNINNHELIGFMAGEPAQKRVFASA